MPNIFELQLRGMGAGKYSKSHNLLGMRVQRAELSTWNCTLTQHSKRTQEKTSMQKNFLVLAFSRDRARNPFNQSALRNAKPACSGRSIHYILRISTYTGVQRVPFGLWTASFWHQSLVFPVATWNCMDHDQLQHFSICLCLLQHALYLCEAGTEYKTWSYICLRSFRV